MSWTEQRERIKLDILASLARSQKALADMIENIAEMTDRSAPLARHLRDNAEAIARYQETLAAHMTGLRFGISRRGVPQRPWLHPDMSARGRGQAKHQDLPNSHAGLEG